jgi:hypothetical protein
VCSSDLRASPTAIPATRRGRANSIGGYAKIGSFTAENAEDAENKIGPVSRRTGLSPLGKHFFQNCLLLCQELRFGGL